MKRLINTQLLRRLNLKGASNELAITFDKIELIRKPSGELITYAEILRAFEIIFNIHLPKNIYSRKIRTMERKKSDSPLLERMLALYRH